AASAPSKNARKRDRSKRTPSSRSTALHEQGDVKMTRYRTGDEKQILSEFLDQQLDVLLWKLEGLTDDQLRHPVTPSGMCLLALVKHVAGVAYYWVCEVFARPFEPWPGAETDDVELDSGDTTHNVLGYSPGARAASD